MDELPKEIVEVLLLNLSITDIEAICSSSNYLSSICRNDRFWETKLTSDYPLVMQVGNSWRTTAHILRNIVITIPVSITKYNMTTGYRGDDSMKMYSGNEVLTIEAWNNLKQLLTSFDIIQHDKMNIYFLIKGQKYGIREYFRYVVLLTENHRQKIKISLNTPLYQISVNKYNLFTNLEKIIVEYWTF